MKWIMLLCYLYAVVFGYTPLAESLQTDDLFGSWNHQDQNLVVEIRKSEAGITNGYLVEISEKAQSLGFTLGDIVLENILVNDNRITFGAAVRQDDPQYSDQCPMEYVSFSGQITGELQKIEGTMQRGEYVILRDDNNNFLRCFYIATEETTPLYYTRLSKRNLLFMDETFNLEINSIKLGEKFWIRYLPPEGHRSIIVGSNIRARNYSRSVQLSTHHQPGDHRQDWRSGEGGILVTSEYQFNIDAEEQIIAKPGDNITIQVGSGYSNSIYVLAKEDNQPTVRIISANTDRNQTPDKPTVLSPLGDGFHVELRYKQPQELNEEKVNLQYIRYQWPEVTEPEQTTPPEFNESNPYDELELHPTGETNVYKTRAITVYPPDIKESASSEFEPDIYNRIIHPGDQFIAIFGKQSHWAMATDVRIHNVNIEANRDELEFESSEPIKIDVRIAGIYPSYENHVEDFRFFITRSNGRSELFSVAPEVTSVGIGSRDEGNHTFIEILYSPDHEAYVIQDHNSKILAELDPGQYQVSAFATATELSHEFHESDEISFTLHRPPIVQLFDPEEDMSKNYSPHAESLSRILHGGSFKIRVFDSPYRKEYPKSINVDIKSKTDSTNIELEQVEHVGGGIGYYESRGDAVKVTASGSMLEFPEIETDGNRDTIKVIYKNGLTSLLVSPNRMYQIADELEETIRDYYALFQQALEKRNLDQRARLEFGEKLEMLNRALRIIEREPRLNAYILVAVAKAYLELIQNRVDALGAKVFRQMANKDLPYALKNSIVHYAYGIERDYLLNAWQYARKLYREDLQRPIQSISDLFESLKNVPYAVIKQLPEMLIAPVMSGYTLYSGRLPDGRWASSKDKIFAGVDVGLTFVPIGITAIKMVRPDLYARAMNRLRTVSGVRLTPPRGRIVLLRDDIVRPRVDEQILLRRQIIESRRRIIEVEGPKQIEQKRQFLNRQRETLEEHRTQLREARQENHQFLRQIDKEVRAAELEYKSLENPAAHARKNHGRQMNELQNRRNQALVQFQQREADLHSAIQEQRRLLQRTERELGSLEYEINRRVPAEVRELQLELDEWLQMVNEGDVSSLYEMLSGQHSDIIQQKFGKRRRAILDAERVIENGENTIAQKKRAIPEHRRNLGNRQNELTELRQNHQAKSNEIRERIREAERRYQNGEISQKEYQQIFDEQGTRGDELTGEFIERERKLQRRIRIHEKRIVAAEEAIVDATFRISEWSAKIQRWRIEMDKWRQGIRQGHLPNPENRAIARRYKIEGTERERFAHEAVSRDGFNRAIEVDGILPNEMANWHEVQEVIDLFGRTHDEFADLLGVDADELLRLMQGTKVPDPARLQVARNIIRMWQRQGVPFIATESIGPDGLYWNPRTNNFRVVEVKPEGGLELLGATQLRNRGIRRWIELMRKPHGRMSRPRLAEALSQALADGTLERQVIHVENGIIVDSYLVHEVSGQLERLNISPWLPLPW